MSEKQTEDYWNVDGERDLSDLWTDFTRFTMFSEMSEKTLDGYTWSGKRLTKKQTSSRSDMWKPNMETYVWCFMTQREKHKWTIEKPKLEIVRGSRGIYFIDPEDEEFISWSMPVESWNFRCQQQCLVKLHCAEVAKKPAASLENTKQNSSVLLNLTNPWESDRSFSQKSWGSHCKQRYEFI